MLLCSTLARDLGADQEPVDAERLQRAISATQATLRRKAIARTHAIFALRPRDYGARVERAYLARRRASPPRSRRHAA